MATTGKRLGQGAQFWLHDGNALVRLTGVFDIGFPDEETEEVDVTDYDSNGYNEFIAGLTDRGEFEVQMHWVPDSPTDDLVRAARAQKNNRAWRIIVPDEDGTPTGWKIDGTGFAKNRSRSLPNAGVITDTLTIRVSGDIAEGAV